MAVNEEEVVAALEKYTEAMQTIKTASWSTLKDAFVKFYRQHGGRLEAVGEVEALARQMGLSKTDG